MGIDKGPKFCYLHGYNTLNQKQSLSCASVPRILVLKFQKDQKIRIKIITLKLQTKNNDRPLTKWIKIVFDLGYCSHVHFQTKDPGTKIGVSAFCTCM
jgi:hypothetical protein